MLYFNFELDSWKFYSNFEHYVTYSIDYGLIPLVDQFNFVFEPLNLSYSYFFDVDLIIITLMFLHSFKPKSCATSLISILFLSNR